MSFRVQRTETGVHISTPIGICIDVDTDVVHIEAEDIPLLVAELQHMWEHHRIYTDMGQVSASDSGMIGK
jgi:hypothetical protein